MTDFASILGNKLRSIDLNENTSILKNLIKDFNNTYIQYKSAVEKYGDDSPQVENKLKELKNKQNTNQWIKKSHRK